MHPRPMACCSLFLAVVLLLGLFHTSLFTLDTVGPVINHRIEVHEDTGSPVQLFVILDSTKNRSASVGKTAERTVLPFQALFSLQSEFP